MWALAACVSTEPVKPSSVITTAPTLESVSATGPDLRMAWRNPGLYPIRQPIAVGGVAVGVVADHRELYAVGIDPVRGTKLWQQQITPSEIRLGEAIEITIIGEDRIAFFVPTRHDNSLLPYAALVIAEARTGRYVARSPEALFVAQPVACRGGTAACVVLEEWGEAWRAAAWLDAETRTWTIEPRHLPARTRTLGEDGLVDLGNRPDEVFARLVDGQLRWTVPAARAFPDSFSSDWGWSWHHYADARIYVGSLYGRPELDGDRDVYDLAVVATAGIAEATGEVVWRDRGSHLAQRFWDGAYPVRSRTRGQQTIEHGASRFRGLDVVLERFDPASGQTTWRLELGEAPALAHGDVLPAVAGPTQAVVATSSGPVILDYARGTTAPPAPGRAFWCVTRGALRPGDRAVVLELLRRRLQAPGRRPRLPVRRAGPAEPGATRRGRDDGDRRAGRRVHGGRDPRRVLRLRSSHLLDVSLDVDGQRDLGEVQLLLQDEVGVGADLLLAAQLLEAGAAAAQGGEAEPAALLERLR